MACNYEVAVLFWILKQIFSQIVRRKKYRARDLQRDAYGSDKSITDLLWLGYMIIYGLMGYNTAWFMSNVRVNNRLITFNLIICCV